MLYCVMKKIKVDSFGIYKIIEDPDWDEPEWVVIHYLVSFKSGIMPNWKYKTEFDNDRTPNKMELAVWDIKVN